MHPSDISIFRANECLIFRLSISSFDSFLPSMRSAILAARQRAAAGGGTGGGGGGPSSASSAAALPPSPLPPSSSSAAAAVGGRSSSGFPLPKWNSSLTKKNTLREEPNATARRDTELRRAKKENREPNFESDELDEVTREEEEEAHGMEASGDEEDKPVTLSAAKRAFLASANPDKIGSSLATGSAASASSSAAAAALAAQPVIPAPASAPTSLPPFSPSKKLFVAPRGSGIVPRKGSVASTVNNTAAEKPERYYNVGFCARSTKKHKNYEDGVLIVCGRRCTLKVSHTSDGPSISTSTDCFTLTLSLLCVLLAART
jgi:hypothetical protein